MANFEDLNEKLLKETVEQVRNSEAFQMLVRMHLSFVLNLDTDMENGPIEQDEGLFDIFKLLNITKRTSAMTRAASAKAANASLSKEKIVELNKLIAFLGLEENIAIEGIFRKTGRIARQKELKAQLDQGTIIPPEQGRYMAHDCANVVKSFLAELSEPLLTEMHFPAYCQLANLVNSNDTQVVRRDDRILCALQLLILLLPEENRVLFRSLIELLNRVIQYEATNKMSAKNLAILFTPHLVCPRSHDSEKLSKTANQMFGIIEFMIKAGPQLYQIPDKLSTDIRANFQGECSTSDSATNTVFTFVDREKTAEAQSGNYTEWSLEKLHAYVQAMPESGMKKNSLKTMSVCMGIKNKL